MYLKMQVLTKYCSKPSPCHASTHPATRSVAPLKGIVDSGCLWWRVGAPRYINATVVQGLSFDGHQSLWVGNDEAWRCTCLPAGGTVVSYPGLRLTRKPNTPKLLYTKVLLKAGSIHLANLGILTWVWKDSNQNIQPPPFKDTHRKHNNALPDYCREVGRQTCNPSNNFIRSECLPIIKFDPN